MKIFVEANYVFATHILEANYALTKLCASVSKETLPIYHQKLFIIIFEHPMISLKLFPVVKCFFKTQKFHI